MHTALLPVCHSRPVVPAAEHRLFAKRHQTRDVQPFKAAASRSRALQSRVSHRTRAEGESSSGNGSGTAEADEGTPFEDDSEEALEAKMQEFLRQQALQESGQSYVAPAAAKADKVLGADSVTDEEAKQYCKEVREQVKLLKSNRDMAFNEIKLTLAIEDPRARERRQELNIEDDSGVSRDELAAALTEVAEGRIPKDRLALRELAREMREWPYADLSNDSRISQLSDAGIPEGNVPVNILPDDARRKRRLIGRDRNEAPQGFEDLLPDWVGYGALYVVSIAPILIGGAVVLVLFLNSVK